MNTISLPLVVTDCDLRDFAFMPLDVVRLRDSDLAAISSGDEFRCAVLLWCASWHQLPASSLPDDDIILSQLAGFGRVVKEWKKVREGSLRGWVKCEADGRLYHPVIAEKATEAWNRKREQAWRTECGRIKKLNQRHNADIKYPTLDDFLSPNYLPEKLLSVPDVSLGTKAPCPEGQPPSVPDVSLGKQHPIDSGQGQGQGEVNLKTKPQPSSPTEPVVALEKLSSDDFRAIPDVPVQPGQWLIWFNQTQGTEYDPGSRFTRGNVWQTFTRWCGEGVSTADVAAGIARALTEAKGQISNLPGYVEKLLLNDQQARASPQRISHSDASKLAAARAIFGTEIEGNQHGQGNSRIIDIPPTTQRRLGG